MSKERGNGAKSEASVPEQAAPATSHRKLRPVGAVMNAIRVLRHLSESGKAEGATQIARATDMYPGTCYQLLRTLVQDNLLRFDEVAKTYVLSSGLGDLVAPVQSGAVEGFPLKRRVYMSQLSQRFAATVYLIGRLQHDRGVLIDFAQPPEHAGHSVVSSFETIYQGAMGRVATYLHHADRSGWREVFERMQWQDPPSFEAWKQDVEAVGQLGYAVDRGHRSRGVTVVAVPICNGLGESILFLAVLLFTTKTTESLLSQIGNAAKLCAEQVRHEASMQDLTR